MTTDIVKHEAPAPILAERPPTALLPQRGDLEAMALIAGQAVKATGMIPAAIKTKEQALAVMLAGWELGLRPMTALRHVYVVNGKTEIETRAMVGIIKARRPEIQFGWPEYTKEAVTCEIGRPGQPLTRVRYTVEDAKASGQMSKQGPWQSYTRDMLYAAATKRACRLACPDLINAIEGAMHTETEALNLTPIETTIRVLDEPTGDIPPDAFNEGDDGDLPVEVQAPATIDQRARMKDLMAEARATWDKDSFDAWTVKMRDRFPALASAKTIAGLSDEELTEIADAMAIDVRPEPEMAL